MRQEHIHGMFAEEPENRRQHRQPEKVPLSEISDIDRDDAVKNFQKFLPRVTLPENNQRTQKQQVKKKEEERRDTVKMVFFPLLSPGEKIALGTVDAENHGKGIVQ